LPFLFAFLVFFGILFSLPTFQLLFLEDANHQKPTYYLVLTTFAPKQLFHLILLLIFVLYQVVHSQSIICPYQVAFSPVQFSVIITKFLHHVLAAFFSLILLLLMS